MTDDDSFNLSMNIAYMLGNVSTHPVQRCLHCGEYMWRDPPHLCDKVKELLEKEKQKA